MSVSKTRPEGLVTSRKNRLIGVEISLVYLPEEDPSCRWQTQCDHGNCVGHETRKLGESFLSVPWEWCSECDTAKKAKEHRSRAAFRRYLNAMEAAHPGPNHKHGRYEQRTRRYGDYLYAQDREKFEVDYAEWLEKHPGTDPVEVPSPKQKEQDPLRRRPIEIQVGAQVRYLGAGISRPKDGCELKTGALGTVVEIKRPVHGTGIYFEELEDVDRGYDGYAIVQFEGWPSRTLIYADGEGTRWERV